MRRRNGKEDLKSKGDTSKVRALGGYGIIGRKGEVAGIRKGG